MKKIHMIAALLAMLPTVLLGNSTTYYYAKLTVSVSTGKGKVYADKTQTESSNKYGNSSNASVTSDKSESTSITLYAFAKADYGYTLSGWATTSSGTVLSGSNKNPYGYAIDASNHTSSSSPASKSLYAKFTEKDNKTVTLAVPNVSAGFTSYKVTGNKGFTEETYTSEKQIKTYYDETYTFTCNLNNTRVYEFAGWDVGGSTASTENPYSTSFSAATTIKAVIEEKAHGFVTLAAPTEGSASYTVSGNNGFNGTGLAAGATFKAYNDETYTFTCNIADPSVYEFAGWEVDGTVVTTDATLTRSFTPKTTATVKAVLNMKEQYRLTLTKPTGVTSYTVTGPTGADGLFNGGELDFFGTADFTFNCTIDDNYKFLNWAVTDGDGTSAPTTRTLQKRVSSNTSVAAVVAPKETYSLTLEKPEGVTSYTVTATPGGTMGNLSAGGTATVREQDSYQFECAINDVEYVFAKWLVKGANGSTIAESEDRVFTTTFTSAATVTAVLYKKKAYKLTFVKPDEVSAFTVTGPHGAVDISAEGKATVYELDSYTIRCAFDGDNYEIVNWTVTDTSGATQPTADTVTRTFNSDATVTVTLAKLEMYIATCPAVPSGCSYKVRGGTTTSEETVATADMQVKGEKGQPLTVTLSAASAGSGYQFAGWYIENQDGSKTYISKDSSVTQTFESHVTIGADFVSAASSSKAALVVKASGGYGEYDDLKAAFDDLESGDSITICKSATLEDSAAVVLGATLSVSSGVTLTIASGKTLYVDGAVSNSGTISGTVSKCTKLIKQSGQSDGVPFSPNPFDANVKYWKTTTTTPSISISAADTHTTIVNGYGNAFRTNGVTSAATFILVSVDTSKAVNHITGIISISTSKNILTDTIKGGMAVFLSSDCVINGGTADKKLAFTGRMDCAGQQTLSSISGKEVSNGGASYLLNCPSFTMNKSVGNNISFYNCRSITFGNFNAKGSVVLNFYDCGTYDNKANYSATFPYDARPNGAAVFRFYSGFYESLTFATGVEIYGGYYKSNPGTEGAYLASGKNLKAKTESAYGNYYHVYADVPEKVAQIGDSTTSQYATLQEAVNAVTAGQTVKLLKNYAANEAVTIESSKSFTLNLNGYAISGTSGTIANDGTLQLCDYSGGKGSCSYSIVNNGTMNITYGTYSGTITLNAGILTTHNGTFNNAFEFGSGVSNPADVLAIRGGMFKKSVKPLLVGDYCEVTHNGLHYVGEFPYAIKSSANLSGAEKSWALTAVSNEARNVYMNAGKIRSSCSSEAIWRWYAELDSALTPYVGFTIDCVLSFDRPVAKSSVKAYANAKVTVSDVLDKALAANEEYRVLSPKVAAAGYYQIDFYRFITGGDFPTTLSAGIADVNAANAGTVATIELQLCHSNRTTHVLNKDYAIATCRYMLGGWKAAIDRGQTRNVYNSLTTAVSAVQDGETILLGADTSESVTFNNPGTYVIDEYGFAFHGSVAAKDGYDITETTGTDEKGFVTHTYVIKKAGPPDPVEKVVIDGATPTAAQEEEMRQEDDNGNAHWQNYVMGLDGATAAAIVTSTNGAENVAEVVVSFEVPSKNTGYTVKYAFDEVNENGTVKEEGGVTNSPALNLERVAVAGTPAYFKMRAVLESNDEKHTFTTNVPVDHTVGVLKVDSSATNTILAVPWKSFDGGNVKVSELVHAASLSTDDMLYAYDSDGNLESWRVNDGVWVPATVVDGAQTTNSDPAAFGRLARGKGVWLKRSDTKKPIYLMGQPTTEAVTNTLTAAEANGEPSWNLVASPKFEAVDWSKFSKTDEIIVPTAGKTPKHYTYKKDASGKDAWGYPGATVTKTLTLPNGTTVDVIKTEHKTGDTAITPGTGFWYLNKGAEKTINW